MSSVLAMTLKMFRSNKFLKIALKRSISTSNPVGSNGILVLNCGSSSVKCQILEPDTGKNLFKCVADRLNTENPKLTIYKDNGEKEKQNLGQTNYEDAISAICQNVANTQFRYRRVDCSTN